MKQVTKDAMKRLGYTALYSGLTAASMYFAPDTIATYDGRTGGYSDGNPADLPVVIGVVGALYNTTLGPMIDYAKRNLKKQSLEDKVS